MPRNCQVDLIGFFVFTGGFLDTTLRCLRTFDAQGETVRPWPEMYPQEQQQYATILAII